MSATEYVRDFWKSPHTLGVFGHIGRNESMLIAELIERHQPKLFVEVGTASGFSTMLIAKCLNEHGGERIASFDLAETWYGDPTKPVGFLATELGASGFPVKIDVFPRKSSVDVATSVAGPIDGAFVDGSHYHPWPTIDAMLLLPRMRPGGFVVFHDLHLFTHENYRDQFGPKFLFDQIPERLRQEDQNRPLSISYAVTVPEDYMELEKAMAKALLMPWPEGERRTVRALPQIRERLAADWGTYVAETFDRILARA